MGQLWPFGCFVQFFISKVRAHVNMQLLTLQWWPTIANIVLSIPTKYGVKPLTFGRSTCKRPSFSTCFGASVVFKKNHVRFLTLDSHSFRYFFGNSILAESIIIFQRSRSSLCTSGGGGGIRYGIWPIVPLWSISLFFCRIEEKINLMQKHGCNVKTWFFCELEAM